MLNDYLETLGTFLSEIKLSVGVRTLLSGRDGCDDSDDDDEPLVDPASTTTGGFADASTKVEPYIPITSTSSVDSTISCMFDLGDRGWAPMCYTSAAIVTQLSHYDGVYCVVPLTEASGVSQALLQNGCVLNIKSVVKAFVDGKIDWREEWGSNSGISEKVQRIICDGLCFEKDLPKILMPHLKHHYHAIREQCKAQFATDFIITSCTYDDPPPAFFGELLALTRRVMVNIDDQIAAREAVRDAHLLHLNLRKAKHLALRNATPTAAEWRRYWGMKDIYRTSAAGHPNSLHSLPVATLQCLCDHLKLDSTGLKAELASELHQYFQAVDLETHFALFAADDGKRRKRRPDWRSPACGLPLAKRARPEEFSEEYYGHVCTIQKWALRLVAQTRVARKRLRDGDKDKRKMARRYEKARLRRRAMLDLVRNSIPDHTPDEHATARKRARLLRARELIGQGHFHHDVRPPVRLELPQPLPVPGRPFAFDSDLP